MTSTTLRFALEAPSRAGPGFALAAALALPAPAAAQTAGQLTRPTYAPPVVRPVPGGLALGPAAGPDAPAGAEALRVTPSGLSVEGGLAELAAATAEIEAALKGRRVTGADLFAAARKLEQAYARVGFVLVRVTLPPQTIRDGMPLRLIVTRGRIETIDASALPAGLRPRIEAVLAPLVGQSGVTQAELERRILLAGDTPGLKMTSTLKAGTRPGSAVLVVDGRYDPVTATLSADNGLTDKLGRYNMNLAVEFNSPAGLGEVGYLRVSGAPAAGLGVFGEDPRERQLVAGLTLPLGTDGAWTTLEAVDSRTHPASGLAVTTVDHYQRLAAKFGMTWIRTRDFNTASTLGLDLVDETQKLQLGQSRVAFTIDNLRVLRLSQSADATLPWGARLGGNLTASFGLDAFGARSGTAALPLSRDGARPDFTKLELTASYVQAVFGDRLQLSMAAKAQTSFGQVLVSSEEIGLGGFDGLSAFGSGVLQGDAGALLRAEAGWPLPPDVAGCSCVTIAPYLFAAGGLAELEKPTALERGLTRAAAVGSGIRFGLSDQAGPQAATLTLEYAHGEASGLASRDRLNLRITARF